MRLDLIEVHLKQCEQHQAASSEYAVMIKAIPAQRIASIRTILPDYQSVDQLFQELERYQRHHRLKVQAAIGIWHNADYQKQDVDGEASFVIEGRLPDHPRIKESSLPAIETAACIIHNGPWNNLEDAYNALIAWIDEQGYQISGPCREIYHYGENDYLDPGYVTEIQLPIDLSKIDNGI